MAYSHQPASKDKRRRPRADVQPTLGNSAYPLIRASNGYEEVLNDSPTRVAPAYSAPTPLGYDPSSDGLYSSSSGHGRKYDYEDEMKRPLTSSGSDMPEKRSLRAEERNARYVHRDIISSCSD